MFGGVWFTGVVVSAETDLWETVRKYSHDTALKRTVTALHHHGGAIITLKYLLESIHRTGVVEYVRVGQHDLQSGLGSVSGGGEAGSEVEVRIGVWG
jgi:hypothetical protein